MKTILHGNNMHVITQALKGDDRPHLPHSLECGEHIHQSDFWEQIGCGHSEKPDGHSDHHCQGHESPR